MDEFDDREIRELESASIASLIMKYGIPAILTLLAISSYEMADRIIVGQFGSALELSVLGVGLPLIFLLEAMCAMVKTGSSCALSRTLGKGDLSSGQKLLGSSYLLALIFGLVVLVCGTLFSRQIAVLCGATDDMITSAAEYIFYLALGAPFYFALFVSNGMLRALGKPGLASAVVIASTVINIGLDLLFVAVFHLGAKGAAMGTMWAQIVGAILGILFAGGKKNLLHFSIKQFNLGARYVKEILAVGFSSALFEFTFVIYGLVLNQVLSQFDDPRLLAVNVAISSIILLINAPMTGIGEAAQTIVAYNYGRRNMARVRKATMSAWAVGAGVLLVIGVFIQMFPELMVKIFVSDDEEFIRMSASALRIAVCMAPFMSSMLFVPDVLGALGDAKSSILLNFVSLLVVQIPLVLLLPRLMGASGVWVSFPAFDVLSTALCFFIYSRAYKKLKDGVCGSDGSAIL